MTDTDPRKVATYKYDANCKNKKSDAEQAKDHLRTKGFTASIKPEPNRPNQSVYVSKSEIDDLSLDEESTIKYLLAVYNDSSANFRRNEDGGDSRVNLYITLATAVMGGLIVIATQQRISSLPVLIPAIILGGISIFIIGYATFLRIIKRNTDTDEYIQVMRNVGTYFVLSSPHIHPFVNLHDPLLAKGKRSKKTKPWKLDTGGLLQTVAIINSLVAASVPLLVALAVSEAEKEYGLWLYGNLIGLAIVLVVLIWTLQMLYASHRYKKKE